MPRAKAIVAVLGLLLSAATAGFAGSPRWVMGTPYYAGQGVVAFWHNSQPLYYTDPGDLSASVNHAAADAMVAAAMNTWNVPQASLALAQGGELAEHVSGANVYVGAQGPVFPADVMASNAAKVPIAVIYDSDGSVTDLLLGSGASDPAECLRNAVTSTVDLLQPNGDIQHALLVLNGRCTGPAPQQQLQMQYQLERQIGRIVGLGWSQLNDNVFTGNPLPTAQQLAYWPIMHPIDVICGTYTYQCLSNPFQLRPDDISTLVMLYQVGAQNVPAGKQYSLQTGDRCEGFVYFPTGQGMQGVNVVATTWYPWVKKPNGWQLVSAVSGMLFQQAAGNPVTGGPAGQQSAGDSMETMHEGYYQMGLVPMVSDGVTAWNGVITTTEPINPLYTGSDSVGTTVAQTIAPSGSAGTAFHSVVSPVGIQTMTMNPASAAADCDTREDGSEASPAAVSAGGWWNGRLCAYKHTAWLMLPVKAQRTLTMEVTALDESGHATTAKAMPVMGLWNGSDALGQLPTVAATASPLNSVAMGMTTLTAATPQTEMLRMAIADERGDGRPDFAYQARVLYADTVTPARLASNGGQITITGTGFRAGNTVTVGGVNAAVVSWSSTKIVATALALSAVTTSTALSADVVVTDLTTHGSSTMSAALTYNGAPTDELQMVSAPSGSVPVGTVAPAAFTVRLLLANGVPVANAPVTFTGTDQALLGSCNAASCAVSTDDSGYASTTVIPQMAGTVGLTATAAGGAMQNATFSAVAVTHSIAAVRPIEYVAAGMPVTWMPQVSVALNGAAAGNTAVTWSATAAQVGGAQTMTNAAGMAQDAATTTVLSAGAQATVQACAWGSTCTTMMAEAVDGSVLRLQVVSGAGQSVAVGAALAPVTLRVTDGANDPVDGATVQIHQEVDGPQSCPSTGRCPSAPVYATGQTQVVSDEDGLVTVTPLVTPGRSEVVNIAAAVGTQGFVSLSLQVGP